MTQTRGKLLERATDLVIVNDGTSRWVGDSDEVYGWLADHSIDRGYHSGYRTRNSAVMDSEQYQSLCDETTCYVDTSGSYGPSGEDPYELIDALSEAGAKLLYIH